MIKNRYLSKIGILVIISLVVISSFSPLKKAEAVSDFGEPILGQISLLPYNFVPRGWLKCTGQSLNIGSNQALYSLLGNKFGGDGRTTFNLPDLKDASPVAGANYYIAIEGVYPQQDGGMYSGRLGEIGLFPYNFTPGGWAPCDGSLMAINVNPALFSLIGTMFGGNGSINFALPNLQQCAPLAGLRYCISVTGMYPQNYGNAEDDGLLGSISLFPNNTIASRNPSGLCNGQTMNLMQNQALFSLVGTNFGGDGRTNFALPDLRGAAPDPHLRYFVQLTGIYPMRS